MNNLSLIMFLLISASTVGQGRAADGALEFVEHEAPGYEVPVVTGCWYETQYFTPSLHGPLDYCRGQFKFEPGAVDCYQFVDEVCSIFLPVSQKWTESRKTLPPTVFACPKKPKPPQCPPFR